MATANFPDPECKGPEQYAVMASLAEVLVESFIWRLELDMRRTDKSVVSRSEDPRPFVPEVCPAWTAKVAPLTAKLLRHPEQEQGVQQPLP